MGFRGNLRSISLADILQNLALNQQTGTLHVAAYDRAKNLYFRGGQITGLSEERRKGLLLGEVLVGRGMASEHQVRAALRRQGTSGGRLGEILVEMGIVTLEQIRDLVRFQVEEDIYDLFTWDEATFEFSEGELPEGSESPENTEAAGLNIGSLIMEAARRIDEWDRIRAIIPSVREVFVVDPARRGAHPPDRSAPERVVYGLVDGTRDVDDIVSDSYLPRFEVGQILAHFIEEGSIRSATPEELIAAVGDCRYRGRLGQCVKLYERLLAIGRDTDEVREALASLAAEIGENEKAAVHHAVLAERALAAGDEEAAILRLERLVALVPKHVHGREQLARIYAGRNRRHEAVEQYLALVGIHTETGRVTEAKDCAAKALEADPENADILRRLAEIHLGEGDTRAAAAAFERLGDLFAEHHKPRAAAECYRRVLRIEPRAGEARSKLKRVSMRADERERLRRRRTVTLLTIGLVVACALGLCANELRQHARLKNALRRAAAAERLGEFGDAIKKLKPLAEVFSLTGVRGEAQSRIGHLQKRRGEKEQREEALLKRARQKADELLKEAAADEERGDLAGAREKYRAVLRVESLAEPTRKKAEERLARIEEEEAYIQAYLEREKKGFGSLQGEYKAKNELVDRYPHNPVCRSIRLPVEIVTDPPGSTVEQLREGTWHAMGRSPLATSYAWKETAAFRFRLRGYEAPQASVTRDSGARLEVKFKRVPAWLPFRARSPIHTTPIAAPGKAGGGRLVLVGDREGRLYAVEAATGKERWTRPPSGSGPREIANALNVAEGLILLSVFRTVHAVRLADGKTAWSREAGGEVRGGPCVAYSELVDDFCVYAASDDGHLYAFEAKTGQPREWKRSDPKVRAFLSRPCVLGERVYAGAADGKLHAFNAANGKHQTAWALERGVRGDPVAAHGRLYVVSDDGRIYCIDPARDRPAWSFPTGAPVRAAVAATNEGVYVGSTDGKLYALDRKGDLRWKTPFDTKSEIHGAPCAAGGRVYVASRAGILYALNAADGRLLWSYETGSRILGGVAAADGFIFVAAANGRLYAFDESGRE